MIGLTTIPIVYNTRKKWLYTIIVKGDRYAVRRNMRYRGIGNTEDNEDSHDKGDSLKCFQSDHLVLGVGAVETE